MWNKTENNGIVIDLMYLLSLVHMMLSTLFCIVYRMAYLCERRLLTLSLIFSMSVLNDAVDPGLKVQLSQTGLNYAASVAVDILTVKVQQASLPDQSGTAEIAFGKVKYEFKNMKVGSPC